MEAVIIILLVILIGLFLWYILQGRRRWKEQGDNLTKIVGEKVEGSMGVFGDVRQRLGELAEKAKAIEEAGKNISSLQELLRAPKFRGGFGELLLQRLLADILPAGSYSLPYTFKGGETVDAIIRIGGNLVPIDSKFPLEDFKRVVAAKEEEQEALRKQFTQTIKKHIKDVTKYILPDEKTFDFALMYIPAENIYYETIIRGTGESDIFSYALENRVVPVSPNSFYAYLQVIVQGLRGLHIEAAAHEIRGRLGRLQGDLANFQGDYATLGTHIRHAAQKYDEAERKLTKLGDKLQLAGETPVEKLPEGKSETGNGAE